MSRKFLLIGIALLASACGLFQLAPGGGFHEKMFWWLMTPRFAFSMDAIPAPPDYREARYWAELPERSAASEPDKIPVFFLHQTSLRSPFDWNQDLQFPDAVERYAWTKQWQTPVFRDCCLVYSPLYRQATFAAYWTVPEGYKARDVAFEDVRQAFEAFATRELQGRPFILAGHSQGAEHGLRLLKERIQGTPLAAQLVAAYLIGIPLGREPLEKELAGFPLCDGETQVGCIVNYLTFRRGFPARSILDRGAWPAAGGYGAQRSAAYACVNPLSWRADDGHAPASRHLGSAQFPGRQAVTSAQCVDGALSVDDLDEWLEYALGGNYHLYDYILFSENLRENAVKRARAFSRR
jgi:hypothetical protein